MAAKATVLTLSLLLVSLGARAENVGNVGAVNQTARGTPPGAAARALSVGLGVQSRERIETDAQGNAQIVFRDRSTMTIGRSSAITIDKFVYNGDAGPGSQGVSLAKGVLRFVGGGVSHGQGAQVKTPTASIGLRGGTALMQVGGSCGTLVVLQYGVATVANSRGSVSLTRPGFAVCAPANGPITAPFLASSSMIFTLNESLASAPGQTGGVAVPPTNRDVNQNLTDSRPPNDVAGPGLDYLSHIWLGDALVQSGTNANNQPPLPPVRPPPPPQTTVAPPPPPQQPQPSVTPSPQSQPSVTPSP